MKRLYVMGPSTCYGMDLISKDSRSLEDYRREHCFSGWLGRDLGMEVVNNSYPMSSLTTIIRKVEEELDEIKPDLVIIGIPSATVREVWEPQKQAFINVLQKEYYFPSEVLPKGPNGVPKLYKSPVLQEAYLNFKKRVTVEDAISFFEAEILRLQKFLEQKKVKYLLFKVSPIIPNRIDETGYSEEENPQKSFRNYFRRLDELRTENWLKFDEFNVIDHFRDYPKGKTGHILEDGHRELARLIREQL